MYPHERSLVEKMERKPFVLLGVNSDESPEKFKAAAAREKITWPCFFDGGGTDGPIATRWGVTGWPTTYVIDSRGVLRHRDLRDEAMEKAVLDLLAEAKAGRR
jgi:peroxiredoxin